MSHAASYDRPVRFTYVGPADVRDRAPVTVGAVVVDTAETLGGWLAGLRPAERSEPVTFVVRPGHVLVLGPRRSEHVALAEGREVLAAGELTFDGPRVCEASNQSTGYCPDPDCWPAVARALDRAGIPHPGHFTTGITFRRCEGCDERNIVRDGDFTCALCAEPLPATWNFA